MIKSHIEKSLKVDAYSIYDRDLECTFDWFHDPSSHAIELECQNVHRSLFECNCLDHHHSS